MAPAPIRVIARVEGGGTGILETISEELIKHTQLLTDIKASSELQSQTLAAILSKESEVPPLLRNDIIPVISSINTTAQQQTTILNNIATKESEVPGLLRNDIIPELEEQTELISQLGRMNTLGGGTVVFSTTMRLYNYQEIAIDTMIPWLATRGDPRTKFEDFVRKHLQTSDVSVVFRATQASWKAAAGEDYATSGDLPLRYYDSDLYKNNRDICYAFTRGTAYVRPNGINICALRGAVDLSYSDTSVTLVAEVQLTDL